MDFDLGFVKIEVKNHTTEESSLEDGLDPNRQQIGGENVLEVTETTTQGNVNVDASPLTENSMGDSKTSTEKASWGESQSSSNTDSETLTKESIPEGTTTTEDIENDMNSDKNDPLSKKTEYVTKCEKIPLLVCGLNGKTYDNNCLIEMDACLTSHGLGRVMNSLDKDQNLIVNLPPSVGPLFGQAIGDNLLSEFGNVLKGILASIGSHENF